ncbi:MAG: hypothetical protein SF172_04680 [Burkholderiales bacterium]|nr:hypothetical protein [Burkholderiales bacterium]
MNKVSNETLLNAGLDLMAQAGNSLVKVPTSSRAMIYRLQDGSTVRVRTCNDHVLVVLADAAEAGARLNIEGTDHLLVVMPEIPRTKGNVHAYFLPTAVAVSAVRESHAAWLASNPATKGNNRTWNIWFDDYGALWGDFATKWAKYRLKGNSATAEKAGSVSERTAGVKTLGEVIAEARRIIAEAAGVPIDAVKVSIALD